MQRLKKAVYPLFIIALLLFSACSPADMGTAAPEQITLTVKMDGSGQGTLADKVPAENSPENAAPQGGPPNGSAPAFDGTQPEGGMPPQGGTPPDGAPGGAPPDGTQGGNPPGVPGGGPGGAPGGMDSASVPLVGVYSVDGTTLSETGKSYLASETDQSAIYVFNGGKLTLKNATISTSGGSSSSDASSFYGLNAGALAGAKSSIDISDSTVTTSGNGANGVFAGGEDALVNVTNSQIDCTGQYAHAVMATLGGTLHINNVDMSTTGASSGAIATDRGSGTITVTGGLIKTSGSNSPAIYATGDITVSNASLSSSGSEAAVIEGANSITLNSSSLISTKEDKWGVMIYQSFSGDAEGNEGDFSMTGGSLTYTSSKGPLFYVTNSTANILLKDVEVKAVSGVLVNASAGRWGKEGANGGTAVLTADKQALEGDLSADAISTLDLTLQNNTSLIGAINSENTAKEVSLTLDASSIWTVTADSYLTTITNAAGFAGTTVSNIKGSGHNVYYKTSANPDLAGKTYSLNGGGYLKPVE